MYSVHFGSEALEEGSGIRHRLSPESRIVVIVPLDVNNCTVTYIGVEYILISADLQVAIGRTPLPEKIRWEWCSIWGHYATSRKVAGSSPDEVDEADNLTVG
jgi:hypothetical protein